MPGNVTSKLMRSLAVGRPMSTERWSTCFTERYSENSEMDSTTMTTSDASQTADAHAEGPVSRERAATAIWPQER
jgi:hypothetical protein